MTAREAVQTAEDARLITLKNQAEAGSNRNAQRLSRPRSSGECDRRQRQGRRQ